jgi:hypothetical protein
MYYKPTHRKTTHIKVHVWAAMTSEGLGLIEVERGIMNSRRYLDMLKRNFRREKPIILQHDRSSVHMARIVQDWLNTQQIQMLEWPAQSPDLNPIENAWAVLKRSMNYSTIVSTDDLEAAILETWNKLKTSSLAKTLVESMPERLTHCIENGGDWTRY